MATIIDGLPSVQYSSIPYDGWHVPTTVTNGYTCGACGGWVASGAMHDCPSTTAMPMAGWQCYRGGLWVFGGTHVCITQGALGYNPPTPAPPCHHCYCIDVAPSGERTKDHYKCCHCQDVRVREQ